MDVELYSSTALSSALQLYSSTALYTLTSSTLSLRISLGSNQIGVEGCKALAAALEEGAAPSLKARDSPIAARTFPAQCAHHASPRVQGLAMGNTEQPELAAVCEERGIELG